MKNYTLFVENENRHFLRNLFLFNECPIHWNIRDTIQILIYMKCFNLNDLRRTFKNVEYLAIKNNNTGKIVYRKKLSDYMIKHNNITRIFWNFEKIKYDEIKTIKNVLSIIQDPYFKEIMVKYKDFEILLENYITNNHEFKKAA